MKLKWLGQGGFLLWDERHQICIDPYLSDAVRRIAGRARLRPAPVKPDDLAADIVICTHNHPDHLDIDAIPAMDLEHLVFLAPKACEAPLRELGVRHYQGFDVGETFSLGAFKLEAVFADHTVPAIGVLLQHGATTVYFSGDTLYHPRLEALKQRGIDLMMICINGRLGNMNAEEAARLTEIIRPKTAVPCHYDLLAGNTADPRSYTALLSGGNGRILQYNTEYEVEGCLI